MTKISASLRLCVNPFPCHSREGGDPWPDLQVGASVFSRRGAEGAEQLLRVSAPLRDPLFWTAQAMDSRLRGNDKLGWVGILS